MSFDKVTIGNATLFCGDAFEILPTLEDEKIDFLASDPPYAAESFRGKCTACEWDKAGIYYETINPDEIARTIIETLNKVRDALAEQ